MRTALWILLALVVSTATTSMAGDERLYIRQPQFRIPFELAPPATPGEAPQEVELWVCTDQRNWSLYTSVKPDAKFFEYNGPWDGEIWFVVRTLTVSGDRLPRATDRTIPELKVVIDRNPPRIGLQARRGDAGQLVVSWDVQENFPLGTRPLLESRPAGGNEPWQAVAVSGGWSGVTELPPQRDPLEIRAVSVDRAGNASAVALRFDPQLAGNIAGQPTTAEPASIQAARGLGERPSTPQLADRGSVDRVAYEVSRPGDATEPPRNPADLFPGLDRPATMPPAQQTASASPSERSPGMPPMTRPTTPPAQAERAPKPNAQRVELPPGVKPHLVDYPRFELHYDIQSLAPQGASQVELWGTADGGQTWELYSVDDDRQSPIQLQVPGDGTYGFRYLARGLDGQQLQASPKSGEPAELWVEVDSTDPVVEILGISDNAVNRRRQVEIRWKAVDRNLTERPIAIYFAYSPSGPWNPLANQLENSGSFVWPNSEFNNRTLYFRVEARDRLSYMGFAEASSETSGRPAGTTIEAASTLR
jgi:hypothetical protein